MKLIQLLLILPFFFVASALVIIAGLIGGRTFHVEIHLRENKDDPLGEISIS
jgi:hypothetical protein